MYLTDASPDYQLARPTADSTDTSYPSRGPTATKPSGDGVLSTFPVPGVAYKNLALVAIGTGSDENTLKLRVLGWSKVGTLWVPTILCELTCTLSTLTGVSGQTVDNLHRFADLLDATGYSNVTIRAGVSDAYPAVALMTVDGYELIEVIFTRNSSSTACNALVRLY